MLELGSKARLDHLDYTAIKGRACELVQSASERHDNIHDLVKAESKSN
jgi:hypothetical protein